MCIDHRRANSVTKFNLFPLPKLNEALDAFAGATVFISLDLAMAYQQVLVKQVDVKMTAFITHVRLCEMIKMPFKLCNAPFTYQRLMSGVLQGLINHIFLEYLDKVIVLWKKRSIHIADFRAVFEKIRSAGLKLKSAKYVLFRDEVLYLGHQISVAGVAIDTAKLQIFADCQEPTIVCKIQSFLGFINLYYDYIADAIVLTSQFYNLTASKK